MTKPLFEPLRFEPPSPEDLEMAAANLEQEISKALDLYPVQDRLGGHVFEGGHDSLHIATREEQLLLGRAGQLFDPQDPPLDKDTWATQITYLPDFQRLRAATKEHDLPLEFVTDTRGERGDTPAHIYRRVVRTGRHLICIADQYNYEHDLSGPGHLLAVMAGGERLILWLVKETPQGIDLARSYDKSTGFLSGALHHLFRDQLQGSPTDRYHKRKFEEALRFVIGELRLHGDPTWYRGSTAVRRLDERQQRQLTELREILYEGLREHDIDRPDILSDGKAKRDRTLGWAAFWGAIAGKKAAADTGIEDR